MPRLFMRRPISRKPWRRILQHNSVVERWRKEGALWHSCRLGKCSVLGVFKRKSQRTSFRYFTEMSAMKLWGTQCMFCPSQMICVTRHLRSAGTSHVRIWEIDEKTKNMTPRDCKLGKLRRTCNCIVVHPDDDKVYCGTQSGTIRTKSESLRLCG